MSKTLLPLILNGLIYTILTHDVACAAVGTAKVSCPSSNTTIYTASNGAQFLIECEVDHVGGDLQMKYTDNFKDCVDLCSTTSGCVDVSYSGAACYLKKDLRPAHKFAGSGAKLISPGTAVYASASSPSPTRASSSRGPSSPTVKNNALTETASVTPSQPTSVASSAPPSSSPASSVSKSSSSTQSSSTSKPSTSSKPAPTASSTSSASSSHPTSSPHQKGSTGCGSALPSGLTPAGPSQSQTFTQSSGLNRTYKIYIPSTYSTTSPSPLMISYHGHSEDGSSQEGQSQFSTKSMNPSTIIIYPNGIDKSWQGAPYADPSVDDIAFTTELLDSLSKTYCIDESRRYATGHSNGGGFVGTLACSSQSSPYFAAFAASSGAFYQNDTSSKSSCDPDHVPLLPCSPSRIPQPFLEVHGTADATIPYAGGLHNGECMPSLAEYMTSWGTRDGLGSANVSTVVTTGDKGTTKFVWGGGEEVVHYRVGGLGHAWASGWDGFSTSPTMMGWVKGFSL
ncbi:MAG: hypothetical protein M1820_008292 [Bogoriella megaspora]|nr:MAG: hypothetical protein M1820_008292 [Bogoriella megaspora]